MVTVPELIRLGLHKWGVLCQQPDDQNPVSLNFVADPDNGLAGMERHEGWVYVIVEFMLDDQTHNSKLRYSRQVAMTRETLRERFDTREYSFEGAFDDPPGQGPDVNIAHTVLQRIMDQSKFEIWVRPYYGGNHQELKAERDTLSAVLRPNWKHAGGGVVAPAPRVRRDRADQERTHDHEVDGAAAYRLEWNAWFQHGWNGTHAYDWLDTWLPNQLNYLQPQLAQIVNDNAHFVGLVRRQVRIFLNYNLIRSQRALPWSKHAREPFFQEQNIEVGARDDYEHPIPVHQLVSLVQMALETHNQDEALRRLILAWLCPGVKCSKQTHDILSANGNGRCRDFNLPLSRYTGRILIKFDGTQVNPDEYKLDDLIIDIDNALAEAFLNRRRLSEYLRGINLPPAPEVNDWTDNYNRLNRRRRRR